MSSDVIDFKKTGIDIIGKFIRQFYNLYLIMSIFIHSEPKPDYNLFSFGKKCPKLLTFIDRFV